MNVGDKLVYTNDSGERIPCIFVGYFFSTSDNFVVVQDNFGKRKVLHSDFVEVA